MPDAPLIVIDVSLIDADPDAAPLILSGVTLVAALGGTSVSVLNDSVGEEEGWAVDGRSGVVLLSAARATLGEEVVSDPGR